MWREVRFPVDPPSAPATVEVVPGATLTVFGTGRLPVARGVLPDRFVTGAVYDADGHLVPRSQRAGGLSHDHAVSSDPEQLPHEEGELVELDGTWLYGGTWFTHFGHFLTETVTSLWPRDPVDGVIFHPFWFGRERLGYQLEATRLLGLTRRPSIVGRQRVRVERLLVPTRPYRPNGYAAPEALGVFDRLREAALRQVEEGRVAAPSVERLFLSRTAHNARLAEAGRPSRRSVPNDAEVDQLATAMGFLVVAPERLTLTEQIALAARATVLCGPSGSALHLSVFAGPGARVIELADGRDWGKPVLSQQILCHARGQRLGFISSTGGPQGHRLDLLEERLAALLDAPD